MLATPRGVVLRIALVAGRGYGSRPTASEAVLWALRRGERPRLFDDQYRSPIDPESVAALIEAVLRRQATGLFHAGGPERLSRYSLGCRLADRFGLPASAIERASRSVQTGAARPADASLSSEKARRELEWQPRALDDVLAESREPESATSREA